MMFSAVSELANLSIRPHSSRHVLADMGRCLSSGLSGCSENPERPKIDTRGSGVPPIYRMSDYELRQAAFRAEVREPFAEIGADSRA
jgi:hypothetical protein